MYLWMGKGQEKVPNIRIERGVFVVSLKEERDIHMGPIPDEASSQ